MSDTTTERSLDELAADARTRIAASASLADLEALKVELFGKKGAITSQLKTLGTLAPDSGQVRKAVPSCTAEATPTSESFVVSGPSTATSSRFALFSNSQR